MNAQYKHIALSMILAYVVVIVFARDVHTPEHMVMRVSTWYEVATMGKKAIPEALLTPVPLTPAVPFVQAPVSAIVYSTEKQIVTCPESGKTIDIRLFDSSRVPNREIIETICREVDNKVR